jgi:ferredoxin--NADP+ reductase
MSLNVAIVGSGPAGFYTAEALSKGEGADVRIDIIDRLATPFGLIRAGVAPDHQTTKRVAEAFGRTALRDEVRYFGNVKVGRDVSLDELREVYDAVVLAVGAPFDHLMKVPGEDKLGVYGSAAFVGWYNGHPDFLSPDHAAQAIQAAPITDVYMIGRRGPVEAKFTNVELREMGKLEICDPVVDPAQLPDTVGEGLDDRDARLKARNLATLHEFAERGQGEKAKRVHFVFYASPVEVLGGEHVEGLRLERTRIEGGRAVGTGEFFEIDCGLVVPSIGYRSVPVPGAPFDERACVVPNDDGRVADGLYAVGWIKRGPTGIIASNRPDGVTAADHIRADLGAGSKPGRETLETLLNERQVRVISYADWQKIDAAEVAAATPPAPRRKLVTLDDMLAVLDS